MDDVRNEDVLNDDAAGGLRRVEVNSLVAGEGGGDEVGSLVERHLEMIRCWQ